MASSSCDEVSPPTTEERRRRCLKARQVKHDIKRRRVESLQKELERLTNPPLSPKMSYLGSPPRTPTGPASASSTPKSAMASVVVSLPPSASRKSARKMVKDPMAVSVGRREAEVLGKVNELQNKGLWTGKKLAKVVPPSRPKTHWDYVVEEMNWLSSVIRQESKTKKVRKCNQIQIVHRIIAAISTSFSSSLSAINVPKWSRSTSETRRWR